VGASACRSAAVADEAWGMNRDDLLAGRVTILGHTTHVSFGSIDLRTPPAAFADAARRLWWRSMIWAAPLFYPEVDKSDAAVTQARARLVTGLVRALKANPDPGAHGTSAAALRPSNAAGWDEGTNMRREQVLNCLVWATGFDARLVPHLRAAVAANLDPNRYDGPPVRAVNNHGTLANLALVASAHLLGRADWARTAVHRLNTELGGVFSPAGFSLEQSTSYLDVNVDLWSRALDMLADEPSAPDLRGARIRLARAVLMEQYLTDPQGHVVRIGDGDPVALQAVRAHRYLGVVDTVGGVASNRWSWTDPGTSFYVVRFGPAQRDHGHLDHCSILYSTLGVPVLVHPGAYVYGTKQMWGCSGPTGRACYGRGPLGANVAYPTTHGVLRAHAASPLVSLTRSGSVDTIRLVDDEFTTPIRRTARVDDRNHTLTVTDSATVRLSQRFHLDPRWDYVGRTNRSVSFRDGARRLTVSFPSAGAVVNVYRGSIPRMAGWYFPSYGCITSANEIVASGGRTLTAVFTVR
jgi:hypothetical protein